MRRTARPFGRTAGASAVAAEGDAVELHAMVNQTEAKLLGDALLKRLEFVVDELNDVAGLDVDQMVMMALGGRFVA